MMLKIADASFIGRAPSRLLGDETLLGSQSAGMWGKVMAEARARQSLKSTEVCGTALRYFGVDTRTNAKGCCPRDHRNPRPAWRRARPPTEVNPQTW